MNHSKEPTQARPGAGLPKRLLIANRGEIALRIARTARRLGIEVLGVFSEVDSGLPHLRRCHRACELTGDPQKVYLDIDRMIDVARTLKADAIHPGYGFLAENSAFSDAIQHAGMMYVGPTPDQTETLGNKINARKAAEAAGVPCVPGAIKPIQDVSEAQAIAQKIGYPILIKAAAGGGGRGMRVVNEEAGLEEALRRSRSEAKTAFNSEEIFIEKYFSSVRHIEIQILGDGKGNAVSLGERECSVQRRHQKLIEESPTRAIPKEVARRMGKCATDLAASVNYRGAGTMEFLVPSGSSEFYFIEMNTRLQVEHPVTELCTGLDLVEEQLRIAGGAGFSFEATDHFPTQGAAIEARIIAEDPEAQFRPSLGMLSAVTFPSGPGVRVDAWAEAGLEVSPYYDSLLAKVLTWGRTRQEALDRLTLALDETVIAPIKTTAGFIRDVINEAPFRSGNYDTALIATRSEAQKTKAPSDDTPVTSLPVDATVLAAAERLAGHTQNGLGQGSTQGRPLSPWQEQIRE